MAKQSGNPRPQFKIGSRVTYKNALNLPNGSYFYGGSNQDGFVGEVLAIGHYNVNIKCYVIVVTTSNYGTLNMIERDFIEFKNPISNPFTIMLLKRREYKLKYGKTKWQ